MGEMGIDVLHINLHKTFSTPHGGGGPGAGPVCIKDTLEPYLPKPVVEKKGHKYVLNNNRPKSVGKLKVFNGNFGMLLRAYAYIRTLGPEGILEAAQSESFHEAPRLPKVSRPDEAQAARLPKLKWTRQPV